jgi:hypothetical protein
VSNFGRPVARDTEPGAVKPGVLPHIVAAMEYLDTTVIATAPPMRRCLERIPRRAFRYGVMSGNGSA